MNLQENRIAAVKKTVEHMARRKRRKMCVSKPWVDEEIRRRKQILEELRGASARQLDIEAIAWNEFVLKGLEDGELRANVNFFLGRCDVHSLLIVP